MDRAQMGFYKAHLICLTYGCQRDGRKRDGCGGDLYDHDDDLYDDKP